VRRRAKSLVVALSAVVLLVLGVGGTAPTAFGSFARLRFGRAAALPHGARLTGELPAATLVRATITLKPRDPRALAAYAAAVSTPGTAAYHHYLTPAEFGRRFGASPAAVEAVTTSLRRHGLNPGRLPPDDLSIPLAATAGTLTNAFSTSLQRVALPGGGSAYANLAPPALDAAIVRYVQGVMGLQDVDRPRPAGLLTRSAAASSPASLRRSASDSGTGPQPCSLATTAANTQHVPTADKLAATYGLTGLYTANDLGSGQTVALAEPEGDFPSDITAFETCYGISTSVSYQSVDGGPSTPNRDNFDGALTDLGVQTIAALAPAASIVVYQSPSTASPTDLFSQIVNDDTANVVVYQLGVCEPTANETSGFVASENTLFQEAAIQGQSVLAAAGDYGSDGCSPVGRSQAMAVDDPAAQPYVTGVGGTEFTNNNSPPTQSVWNSACSTASGCQAGGGGISQNWTRPSYQASEPTPTPVGTPTSCAGAGIADCRVVPDVSAEADPNGASAAANGYLISYNGQWLGVGGTSGSVALWGAVVALINASSGCHGPIGFANPLLYRAAAVTASVFTDITTGNNEDATTNTNSGLQGYPATAGYDAASGLGTPDAAALATSVCQLTGDVSITDPGAQTSTQGQAIPMLQIQGSDTDSGTLSYAATGLPAGLSINANTGQIIGTPTATGTSRVSVDAIDSTGPSASTTFNWTINPAPPSLSLRAPSSGTVASAIPSSSISGSLSGGSSPSGTITFRVFGPQSGPPTTCTTGGTTVGTATVSGDGTYHPSKGFTPAKAGDYWWYTSYGGDPSNNPAASTCGASMAKTVVHLPPAPKATKLPVISGVPKEGRTVKATTGTWSSRQKLVYSYQWERCTGTGTRCASIRGATRSSYNPTGSDVRHKITVVVTATDPEHQAGHAAAKPVGPVQA
jgi:subtilase family serine protease